MIKRGQKVKVSTKEGIREGVVHDITWGKDNKPNGVGVTHPDDPIYGQMVTHYSIGQVTEL